MWSGFRGAIADWYRRSHTYHYVHHAHRLTPPPPPGAAATIDTSAATRLLAPPPLLNCDIATSAAVPMRLQLNHPSFVHHAQNNPFHPKFSLPSASSWWAQHHHHCHHQPFGANPPFNQPPPATYQPPPPPPQQAPPYQPPPPMMQDDDGQPVLTADGRCSMHPTPSPGCIICATAADLQSSSNGLDPRMPIITPPIASSSGAYAHHRQYNMPPPSSSRIRAASMRAMSEPVEQQPRIPYRSRCISICTPADGTFVTHTIRQSVQCSNPNCEVGGDTQAMPVRAQTASSLTREVSRRGDAQFQHDWTTAILMH